MSRLIFILFVVENVAVRHQFQDDHPFSRNDDNLKSIGKHEDKFMLIPSIGYQTNYEYDSFICVLNGWYYQPLNSNLIQKMMKKSLKIALDLLDTTNETYSEEERFGPFFVRDIKNHKIQLKLSDSLSKNTTTDDNGRFNEKIIVPSLKELNIEEQQILKYLALDNDYYAEEDEGIIYLMKDKKEGGCSIISDIDDTIKISEVPDKKKLMINTFKRKFKAVPGMADVYHSWQSSHKCLIHYVSAMPSQLYYVTQKFLNKENFPGGSFHMRHLKLVDSDKYDLIKKIMNFVKNDASQTHKLNVIQHIISHAPLTQQFIMIGDSGELDPEIYGEIAQRYSDRIKMIFIRLVKGGKNDKSRFESAFINVPNNKWSLFSNASELPNKLYTDEDSTNKNDADLSHTVHINNDLLPNGLSNAIILSMSVFCNILPILLILLYTMA